MTERRDTTDTVRALRKLADEGRALGEWKPQEAKLREAQAAAVKQYADAIKDWTMLADAVDQQISDQRNLVEWWGEHIHPHGKGGTRGKDKQQRRPRKRVHRSAHSFND